MKYYPLLCAVMLLLPLLLLSDVSDGNLRERSANLLESTATKPLERDFTFLLFNSIPDGGSDKFIVVQKRGPDIALLNCNCAGLPLLYAKNTFAAFLDRKDPGGLVVCDKIGWKAQFFGGKNINVGIIFQLPNNSQPSGLYWDPASVISSVLSNEVSESFEPRCNSYVVETQKSQIGVGFLTESGRHSRVQFVSAFAGSYMVSAAEVDAATATTVDLMDVDLEKIRRLPLPIRSADASAVIDDVHRSLGGSDPRIDAAGIAFAKILPVQPCLAAWVSEVESQKLWLADNIACSLAHDRQTQAAVEALAKPHFNRLAEIITNVRKGNIDLYTALDMERADVNFAKEVKRLLPPDAYPEFVRRYLTDACPCPLACVNRTTIARAIDAINATNAEPATKMLVAIECVKYDGLISAIAEDGSTRRVRSLEALVERYRTAQNTFISDLQSQLGAAEAKTVIDKYMGNDIGSGL